MKTRINLLTNVKNDGQPTVKRQSTDGQSQRHYTLGLMKYAAMITLLLTLVCGNVWGDTELVNINISSWSTQSVSAGGSVSGCYFKSASTITNGSGWVKTGNASNTANYIGIPLSGINGSVTITVTHYSTRPTMGYRLVTGNSAYNANYSHTSSMSTTRIGSNGTTTTITINNLSGSYGHLILGATGNATNNQFYISNIVVTTPASSCASNPANPGGLAVGNITQGGATFTITDAANTNNYEIVCKTTSGSPAADATPTGTGTSKTIVIATGLTESTTYYAFVRSVCDASHKSSWVALGSSTFTTKSCSISSCGNATLTYVISVGSSGSHATGGTDLISSATASNTTALDISTTPAYQTITMSDLNKKAAAAVSTCYPTKPDMTGKIGVYNGASYSSTNYLQFSFTVKSGYTFTPCDIRLVVQPVDVATSFRWEVTDGTNSYGYGTATDVPKGSDGGASVLTGLTSTAEMAAGTYYIRLYPYVNAASKTFRLGTDVVLKGTTAAAAPSCSDDTGLAYGETTVNKTYGDAVFTNTLTNPNSLGVTYSSTNTSVATVNSSTGAVTIAGAGTTTIKATWAGNASYCEDEVTYTLNVKPNAGSVTGDWDRFGGETIDLSVSPTGGSSYTYQWQKYNGSGWDNVSNGTVSGATTTGATSANLQIVNCGGGNSGTYRCQVTAGGQTNETGGLQVKVFTLECYNGGTTVYNFTRDGENQAGSVEIDLAANTAYTFKFHVDNVYYGNNASINEDITNYVFCNSDNGGNCASNFTINSGLGGTFTFTMDYSTGGNSSVLGEPELSVTYPRKRIYLSPGVWDADGAKFAYYYFREGGSAAWTDFLTSTECGKYADIPQWNGVKVIAGRINGALDAPAFGDGKCWNQTGNLTVTSNDYIVVNNWDNITYNSTYSTPTYTISYNAGTGGSGTKDDESKTCGVAYTLPNSAVFTRTGYTQTGWTTSDGGAQEYALGGTYTTNEDKTFYPVWTVNNYDLTWNLGGGTTTSAGTGIGSGVSSNTTSSIAFGTALSAPAVTKTGYNFSAWDPAVASTMPATNTTYTATWTVKTTTITIDANSGNHGSTTPGTVTATYGSALPSFTAAAGVSGYSLTGYFTEATSGTKVINADGTLVASTDYADGSGNWNSEVATLTLYAQYEAATPTVTATWPMVVNSAFSAVGTANNASITPSNATKAGTNIGDFNTVQDATYTDYTGKMAKIPATGTIGSSGSVTDDHYIKYTITVASGYTFKPTGFSATVGRFGTDNAYAQAVLKTGATTIKSTEASKPNRSGKSVAKTVYSASFNDASTYAAGTVIDLYIYLGGGMASDKSYGIVAVSITGEYAAASCSAPAAPTISGTASYTAGQTITLTANCASGADASTTYTWYKGADWATARAASPVQAAATGSAGYTFTKASCVVGDAGTYWCEASNGSGCEAHNSTGKAITVSAAGTTYYLVTSTAQLNTTDTYVIMDDGKNAMMGVATGSNAYLNAITSGFTAAADKSTVTVTSSDVNTLTLKSESSAWNLFGKDSHYITTNSTVNGNLYGNATSGSGTDDFVFSFADGKVTIKRNTTTDYHIYYSSGTGFNQSTSSTNIRLYTSNSTPVYTVTYDLNGGTGTVPTNRPEKSGTSITLASSTGLTKDGFTFDGWLCSVNSTKYAAGASYTMTAANTTFTAQWVAAESYSITYHCNGAESGCPSNVAAAYTLPSPLPTGLTKDGYDFGGWFTDSECTVAAVAGAALTGNTDLYAKWTEHIASECITITNFATSNTSCSNNIPDNNSKYFYGYKGTVDDAHAVTITSNDGNDRGQNSGVEMRLTYNKKMRVYANNTTNATPAGFENVVSVSFKWKFIASGNSGNTELTSSYTVKVGSTAIANAVSITGKTNDGYATVTIDNLAQLNGYIEFLFGGSSSSYNVYLDDIEICTADMAACTTPTLPTATLNDQALCEGADIATWTATPTNASTITGKGESISYSWKKKGSETVLGTGATFDLGNSATESQAGTYVVTVTVSKAGYTSATVSEEIELSVTESTEVTSITADKATVYEGNSVTLTATANTTVTWQWYTCTNAAGDGESSIGGATSAAYAIASAPAAGTHYYKVKATSSCGTASLVYALVVSEAAGGDCETEIWVVKAADLPEGATAATHITTPFTGGSNETASITIDGNTYTITQRTSNATGPATIVVPEGNTATLYILVKGNNGRSVILEKGGVEQWTETPEDGWQALSVDNLDAGTYSLRSSNNLGWGLLALKLCSASACSDPEVTASADNTTACVGTSVTFTAANAHASATYQWQKLDGTWTNISDANASTYNIASVVAGDAGKYRVIASHTCNRTSNEVTLSVPSVPNFGSTVPASVSVMQTIALSINTVEATDAVKYRWYKSADGTWDAGDVEIGTNKELIKAYDSEAIGSPSYYIFCRAQNACGITTSTAIAVNVTAYVEEDCATRGNEGDAAFGFEYSASQATYNSTACWSMNDNSKKLIYAAPEGKYFKTMKVTIASSSASKASYNWSTNGGTTFTEAAINSINTTLTEKTFDLSAHGNVNALQIGRNLDGKGESSGTLYVSKICFEYTDACTATTVTPSTASTSYEMGGAWTDPTFTLGPAAVSGETLTYSSSNEDIASVDDDGTVTFNGEAGTVTITASYAGGAIALTEYCASSGSYTITVSCPGGAPKVVASGTTVGCSSSITLQAKQSDGTSDFADGTYQWFRNGTEIDGATGSSYTATQAGTYTVERTKDGCTSPSSNSAVVTSERTEPEVERLVPFQYYHVDKTYSDQMKMRHLFAVKNSGKLDGKSFKMYVSRNGGAATDVTSSNALVVWPNGDGHVDTVMVDLNKLSGKYSEDDELVFTCKAIDCSGIVSEVYKNTITMNVIGETPTLALICSGSSKAGGTRKTGELTVGGDFLTGYNVADLCLQTGNTSFDANTEWGLYTDLKTQYIVTPVNGYAVFNKLNYEPFDILLLTDYPKASKSDAAADVLDDMAALCDYRPMLSFKTHMVAKSPSKWAEKGFTTSPVVTKADGRLNLNIVCYAHPMFESLTEGADVYNDVGNTSAPLVYTMLSGTGFESSKGMQGFEIAAAENFVTIGLTHYNATITKDSPLEGQVSWTPGSGDRMLVTAAERQANVEARFILFSLNCGAQSKLTDKGEQVILACLEYLLDDDPLHVADCSFTFDNGEGNMRTPEEQAINCPTCPSAGDHKWNNPANWGPDYRLLPGEFTSVRIKKPVEVNDEHAHVMEVRIIDEGRIDIPAGKGLDVKSTIRRMDGSEIYPTEENDIHVGSASTGNGTLIFNNNSGDTKARVDMYSKGFIDGEGVKNYQYIGTPFSEVNALYNYYGSWIYYWKADGSGWKAVKNGGPMTAWTGYCITQEAATTHAMSGTLTPTGTVDINVPADANMVVGNSWTAPIDINALTTDDLEGLVANIYFFNTGVDKEGTAGAAGSRYAGGTYVTVPVEAARYVGEDDHINSMQGFFVKNTGGSNGTLHLDYERHVRGTTRGSIIGDALHAPARRAALDSNDPEVLKIKVSGENYDDKLLLLAREDFSTGFDNGWDGDKWDGNESSLYIYATDEEGTENSVSAIPQLEGTIIGFRAGEDDAYTLHFEYLNSDETLYLYDVENNTYTQIMTGMTYRFFTTDNEKHSRFIITRSNGQEVATGVESTSSSLDRSKAKKLLIEDKMFIIVNGMLYDATGKVVK